MVLSVIVLGFFATALGTSLAGPTTGSIQPFRIDLAKGIPHLEALVKNTNLPSKSLYPTAGDTFGVQLDFLRDLKTQWEKGYNWSEQEAELNQ